MTTNNPGSQAAARAEAAVIDSGFVVIELDRAGAVHLAHSLRRWRTGLERAGKPAPPPSIMRLEQTARRVATKGHEGTRADIVPTPVHDRFREREYYSPAEAAAVTGLSKKTIHRRIADGSLPSALFGRSRLIRKRDLLELTCAT